MIGTGDGAVTVMRRIILLIAAMMAWPALAQAPVPRPPKLVVAIVVDQFSAELFERYRDRFTGGMGRLAHGIAFANGYQSHAATETCPGHSTVLTGRHPAATGIIANNWFQRETGSTVYCVAVAGTADPEARGPQRLRVDTLGDWLKAREPGARVVSVSGKDRAAIMLAGHHPDAVYWWVDGKGFRTSSFAGPAGPEVTAAADEFDKPLLDRWRQAPPTLWPSALPADCAQLEKPYRFGSYQASGKVPPPEVAGLETGNFLARPDFADALHASPIFDPLAVDFARQIVAEDRLGRGPATDLLAISLSSTDYIGHRYGNGGAEMCVQMHAIDEALARLFADLDAQGVSYVVALTADHGAMDAVERAADHGLPARRIDGAGLVKALNQHVEQAFGLNYEPILADDPQQLYLNVAGDDALKQRIRDEAVAWLKRREEVAAVFTADQVAASAPPPGKPVDQLSLAERFYESFDRARSGDIAVALVEYSSTYNPKGPGELVAGHGSPWDYDRRVPILFWWPGVAAQAPKAAIETVDIAPTLAAIAGIAAPPVDGRCLAPVIQVCGGQ